MEEHEHDWRVIAEENEPRGTVRLYRCAVCGEDTYG